MAPRDMSGTIGRNRTRNKDSQPTHRGSCMIDGKEYWISAWVKDGSNGRFFSLAFDEKQEEPQSFGGNVDEDIPF